MSAAATQGQGWGKRAILAALGIVVATALLIWVATREAPPAKAAPIEARLDLAAGEVLVDQGKGEERAVSDTPLRASAKIRTGKGSRALVRLPDGSTAFLRGDSAIELVPDAVQLAKGEYWLDAPPTDRKPLTHRLGEVAVTAAEAGLSIRREAEGATLYVARGMAVLTAPGGRVEVNAGEQASVKGKEAPQAAPLTFWDDWTGGMADYQAAATGRGAGQGTIFGVDEGAPPGSPAQRLEVSKQVVRAVLREGLSETEVDQTFFNPGERPVEGWYWFTVPERASVTGFAVETDGVLVEGELIERREAAARYAEAKQTGHAPALLEWIDSRSYRARIFPVPAAGTRRVLVRYLELRPIVDGKLAYGYPMGQGQPVRIGEFSLTVDLGDAGARMKIATLADARVEQGGKLVTMRRSGYTPRVDFQLEGELPEKRAPLTLARFRTGGDSADYVMARYAPDVDWSQSGRPRADVVVVVDTSAGGDAGNRPLKTATAEAILRALSDDDRFALVSLDVRPSVLHPEKGVAAASEAEIAKALARLAERPAGGATDLSSLFEVSLERVHDAQQPAVVYVGDGLATSGEMSGEQLIERLRRALSTSRARLFTVAVGADADHALLRELARAGGGESLRVEEAGQTTGQALELAAAIKVPTITDFEIDLGAGLDEPFVSAGGKVSRGSEVIVLARTHHDIPGQAKVRGRLGGKAFEKSYTIKLDKDVVGDFVPRLWAAEYVRRLLGSAAGPEGERGRVVALGIDYGLMTPFTSFLALESEDAYSRMGIQRKSTRLRGRRLGALDLRPGERAAAAPAAAAVPAAAGCAKYEAASGSEEPLRVETASPRREQGAAPAAAPTQAAEAEAQRAGGEADDREGGNGTRRGYGQSAREPAARTAEGDKSGAEATDTPAAGPYAPSPAVAARPAVGELKGSAPGGGGRARSEPPPGRPEHEGPGATPAKAKDEGGADRQAELARAARARERQDAWLLVAQTCSDAARRPLALRVALWRKRLGTARTPAELVARYDGARRACELGDWRAESTFLDLMQQRVETEAGVTLVLGHFADRPDVQKYVARRLLRRTVDPRIVGAIERALFGVAVDWAKADVELSEIEKLEERMAKLRELVARAPDDPNGEIRMIRLLVQAGRKDEALARGRRLRDSGFLSPELARELGDVLARAGEETEAVRTYSEIVEFDPQSIASRRLLGDVYLGHGWYPPAYRQYLTITERSPDDALGWLRLAAAAAGRPGPSDPRRFARLWSAARLARLMQSPPPGADGARQLDAMARKLKELQLFQGPGTLVLLTWEDLGSSLALAARTGEQDISLGESTDAAEAGLFATMMATEEAQQATFLARLRSAPRDDALALVRQDIAWNGKDFAVRVNKHELPARATSVGL
ncbi:MAG: FecR domain-containing protein [Deltaproteobacteria bacterium]|nr:FecR domain-containing protein [Deltaproteobacteria bacterium]